MFISLRAPPLTVGLTQSLHQLVHGQPTSTLYAVSSSGFVWKILSRLGKVLWVRQFAHRLREECPPALWLQGNVRLIAAFASGCICCVSPFDGAMLWSTAVDVCPKDLSRAPSLSLCCDTFVFGSGTSIYAMQLCSGAVFSRLNVDVRSRTFVSLI